MLNELLLPRWFTNAYAEDYDECMSIQQTAFVDFDFVNDIEKGDLQISMAGMCGDYVVVRKSRHHVFTLNKEAIALVAFRKYVNVSMLPLFIMKNVQIWLI